MASKIRFPWKLIKFEREAKKKKKKNSYYLIWKAKFGGFFSFFLSFIGSSKSGGFFFCFFFLDLLQSSLNFVLCYTDIFSFNLLFSIYICLIIRNVYVYIINQRDHQLHRLHSQAWSPCI